MRVEEKQSFQADFKFAFKEVRNAVLAQFLNYHSDDEFYLLSMANLLPIARKKKLLSSVFENSQWFGITMKMEFDKLWTIEEIRGILPLTGIPCILGFWESNKNNDIYTLKHNTCNYNPNLLKCRYWYNALNGLITGLSDKVSFSRHESIGNDDNSCTNVIFNSEHEEQIWKDVPSVISNTCKHLTDCLTTFGIHLNFVGYADGTLYYHLEETIINSLLIATVFKLFSLREPKIQFVNVSDKKEYSRIAHINL